MSYASLVLLTKASLFDPPAKENDACGPAWPEKIKLVAAQQVPEIERVAAIVCSSDRPVLFFAEIPFGPICTNEVLTFAIASPLHRCPVATVIPPAVAHNAKDNAVS
jgi:hypothetical protein